MAGVIDEILKNFNELSGVYTLACRARAIVKSVEADQALAALEAKIQSLRTWKMVEKEGKSSVADATLTLKTQINHISDMFLREKNSDFVENKFIPGLMNISDKVDRLKLVLQDLHFTAIKAGNDESQHSQPHPEPRDLKESFAEELNAFPTPPLKIGSLKTLQNRLPDLSGLVNRILNKDPLDGERIVPENINGAQEILDVLRSAWMEKWSVSYATETLENIRKSPGICLVLRAIDRLETIDDFAMAKFHDKSLHISEGDLTRILGGSDAAKFYIAQYLVKPRQWEFSQHIEISDNEPLPLSTQPLTRIHAYISGGYGTVDKVYDVFRKEEYVRKRSHDEEKAIEQLQNEEEQLRDLGERSHIVQYVKSYKRGSNDYGLLMTPVATGDLSRLLRDAKNSSDHRDFLFEAFGCLSNTLAYIHGKSIRHKDITPRNILYIKDSKSDLENDRFLWADFGNAYGFKNILKSKTYGRDTFTAKYAAPEVFYVGLPHGRSSDVFSLGCVFIDILCVLHNGALTQLVAQNDQRDIPYSKKLHKIRKSILGHIRDPGLDKRLLPLLEISRDMIKLFSWTRPKIDEVVNRLSNSDQAYFCDECFKEAQFSW